MIKVPAASSFHLSHGSRICLLENGTIAHRVRGLDEGIVFTKGPVPVGALFEVKIIEDSKWNGSMVSYNICSIS